MGIDEVTPLLCSRCGRRLDGIDPDEEPVGWDGQPPTAYTLLVEPPSDRVGRSCSSKIAYGSRREARARVRDGRNQDGTLRPYRCQFCGLWHLGHPRRRH